MLDTYFHIGIARFRGTGVFQIADSVEIADSVVEIADSVVEIAAGDSDIGKCRQRGALVVTTVPRTSSLGYTLFF